MDQDSMAKESIFSDDQDISDQGERVSHLTPDFNFYSHLSIYDFAVQFSKGAMVLDAGCGAGYGSAFLAERGAKQVYGVDVSRKAVEFCRNHFQKPNLAFEQMDLEDIKGFQAQFFDLIFSSQSLEHVPHAARFIRTARDLLKPTGTFFLCVPTITDDRFLYLNITNKYHVNIWTPRQWKYVISLFFQDIKVVLHGVQKIGRPFSPDHFSGKTLLTEKDFAFKPGSVRDMYKIFSLNAIFLARAPRKDTEIPAPDALIRFVDESFTRTDGTIDPRLRERLKFYFEIPDQSRLMTEPKDPGRGKAGRKRWLFWKR